MIGRMSAIEENDTIDAVGFAYPMAEDHLKAIGEVVVTWALLEDTVERGIWGLSNVNPEKGRLLTYRMGFAQKLDILKYMVHKNFLNVPSRKTETDSIIQDIKKVITLRNETIHAEWQSSEKPDSTTLVTYKPREGKTRMARLSTDKTAEDIRSASREIIIVNHKVASFLHRHGAYPAP